MSEAYFAEQFVGRLIATFAGAFTGGLLAYGIICAIDNWREKRREKRKSLGKF